MRKAKLHELRLPSKYALWRQYIYGTDLASRIGPERFTQLLTDRQAIELVDQKGSVKCKTLNETLIKQVLNELYSRPFQPYWSQAFSKLVKRLHNAT